VAHQRFTSHQKNYKRFDFDFDFTVTRFQPLPSSRFFFYLFGETLVTDFPSFYPFAAFMFLS